MLQVEIDPNLVEFEKISYIFTLFDLQWLKLTFKKQNMYIFGVSEQFATRKSAISIYRATSNFALLSQHKIYGNIHRSAVPQLNFAGNCKVMASI
jgi:hypothetical protein